MAPLPPLLEALFLWIEALPHVGLRGDSAPEPQNWRFTAGPRPDGSSKAACPAAWVARRCAAPAAG